MKLEDLEKVRTHAERVTQAKDMLGLIEQGPVRLMVGMHSNQAEIILTAHGQKMLKDMANQTLGAMLADATEQLRSLGVEIGIEQNPLPVPPK